MMTRLYISCLLRFSPILTIFILTLALLVMSADSAHASVSPAPTALPASCSTPETETIRGKAVEFDLCVTRNFSHASNDYAIHVFYTMGANPPLNTNNAQCNATELANGRCEHAIADANNAVLLAQEMETAFKFYTDRMLDFAGTVPLPNNTVIKGYIAEDPRAGGTPTTASMQADDEWVDQNDGEGV